MSFHAPSMRSIFIGREAELAALGRMLEQHGNRLITVTGPGGVGKTRLVSELLPGLLSGYPGGVWFVPVAHIRLPELVVGEVAAELGIRDLDASETLDRVAERLDGSPVLLVLDNVEQVTECGGTLAALLQRCPGLTIMATSRQPLQIQGEVEFPLRPLRSFATDSTPAPAEELFLQRAREASYGFEVTAENRTAIQEISRRLGGIPLAIELAASWVKMLPPQRILENLDRQLDVLVRGPRDLPERQQTMRSAIAWSYQLLTDSEQLLFRQLSVFEGPFTLSDTEAVALFEDAGTADVWTDLAVLEALSSLVTKSLVQVLDEPVDPTEPEYSILEIIRAFAFEQLLAAGSVDAVRDRHLSHFTQLAERWSDELSTGKREVRLAQFDREYPNFRAALEWSFESNDLSSGLRLIAALWRYWDWRGFHAEGARWCDRLLDIDAPIDPILRANALYAAAAIAFMQANYPRTMTLADACLATAERTGDERAIARGLLAVGNAAYDQGDLERAGEVYGRSLDMARGAGEPVALQVALVNLAFVRYQQELFEEARSLFEEAASMSNRTGQASASDWALVGLSQVEYRLGASGQAEARLGDVIDRQRKADTGQLGAALLALASIERHAGRLAESQALARESLANRLGREERAFITDSLTELASLALETGATTNGVVLASAVAAQRSRIGYGLPDREWVAQQELLERARAILGRAEFEAAKSRGQYLSFAEMIDFAEALTFSQQAIAAPLAAPLPLSEEVSILTRREQEVLRLIVEGKTDREIATVLSISTGTASRHVANILHKLDVRTRSAAAAWAIRHGLS